MKVQKLVAVVSALAACAVAGCSSDGAPESRGPNAAEVAAAVARDKVQAVFPGVDPAEPDAVLASMRENFAEVKAVRLHTVASDGSHDAPEDVVLTRSGVYAKAWIAGSPTESITLSGSDGYLRAPARFWVSSGMDKADAVDAAKTWVRTEAVADKRQTLPVIRGQLVAAFEKELGAATEAAVLARYAGGPALRVETAFGWVVAAGEPLLPRKYVTTRDGVTVTMTLAYEGIDPVRAPKRNVSLDRVVYH